MRLRISFERDGRKYTHTSDAGPVRIGRDLSCDVVISASSLRVSGLHLEVLARDGRWWVISRGANGTFFNGSPMNDGHEVGHGDRVQLGWNGPTIEFSLLDPTIPGPRRAGPTRDQWERSAEAAAQTSFHTASSDSAYPPAHGLTTPPPTMPPISIAHTVAPPPAAGWPGWCVSSVPSPAPSRLNDSRSNRLVDQMATLLPGQLELLIFKLKTPIKFISSATAPPVTRCIEVVRWAEQVERLADVEELLAETIRPER